MVACTPRITSTLARDPETISGHLVAKGLIPYSLHSRLVHSTDTPNDKAHRLSVAITECIQMNAAAFDAFITVLKVQGDWTKKIVDTLMITRKRY